MYRMSAVHRNERLGLAAVVRMSLCLVSRARLAMLGGVVHRAGNLGLARVVVGGGVGSWLSVGGRRLEVVRRSLLVLRAVGLCMD